MRDAVLALLCICTTISCSKPPAEQGPTTAQADVRASDSPTLEDGERGRDAYQDYRVNFCTVRVLDSTSANVERSVERHGPMGIPVTTLKIQYPNKTYMVDDKDCESDEVRVDGVITQAGMIQVNAESTRVANRHSDLTSVRDELLKMSGKE